jgi:hypothetical protein
MQTHRSNAPINISPAERRGGQQEGVPIIAFGAFIRAHTQRLPRFKARDVSVSRETVLHGTFFLNVRTNMCVRACRHSGHLRRSLHVVMNAAHAGMRYIHHDFYNTKKDPQKNNSVDHDLCVESEPQALDDMSPKPLSLVLWLGPNNHSRTLSVLVCMLASRHAHVQDDAFST